MLNTHKDIDAESYVFAEPDLYIARDEVLRVATETAKTLALMMQKSNHY